MANSLKMKTVIGLLMVMALITAVAAQKGGLRFSRFLAENRNEGDDNQGDDNQGNFNQGDSKALKCNKNPYICSRKNYGSAGPNCCNNKCVNLLTNSNYCGTCKTKCQFASGCCNGKCANLAYDAKNCGKCGNKCKKGGRCVYGMCNYA